MVFFAPFYLHLIPWATGVGGYICSFLFSRVLTWVMTVVYVVTSRRNGYVYTSLVTWHRNSGNLFSDS